MRFENHFLAIAIEVKVKILVIHAECCLFVLREIACLPVCEISYCFCIHKAWEETFAYSCVTQHANICVHREANAECCYKSKEFFHKY